MSEIRVALDVMGGDHAPDVELEGARRAMEKDGASLLLVGPRDRIRSEFQDDPPGAGTYEILHASDHIRMHENPVEAVRNRKDASLLVAAQAVAEDRADVLVSAGNTGAVMVATKIRWGVQKNVERPAIATLMPQGREDYAVLIDVGANVDCTPFQLLQFGMMGVVYSETVLEKNNPTVGLLNLGGEARKGNRLTKKSYDLFQDQPLNFVGNVEGGEITGGTTDVIVCDGFVGNIALKLSEGVAESILTLMKEFIGESLRGRMGAWLMKPVFEDLLEVIDSSEYGGAPLLGLNDGCIIAHGSSSPKAIQNAIAKAGLFVKNECNSIIGDRMTTLSDAETDQ